MENVKNQRGRKKTRPIRNSLLLLVISLDDIDADQTIATRCQWKIPSNGQCFTFHFLDIILFITRRCQLNASHVGTLYTRRCVVLCDRYQPFCVSNRPRYGRLCETLLDGVAQFASLRPMAKPHNCARPPSMTGVPLG
jgi:hypothetical protein